MAKQPIEIFVVQAKGQNDTKTAMQSHLAVVLIPPGQGWTGESHFWHHVERGNVNNEQTCLI